MNWRNADGRTADQFAGLRAAIAAGPTDGPWIACGPSFGAEKPVYCEEVVVDRAGDEDDGHGICQAPTGLATESTVDMDYIAAANPATIRTLLDEHDRLVGEAAVMRDLLREAHGVIKTVQAESTEEADLLAELLRGMEGAIVPNYGGEPHAQD